MRKRDGSNRLLIEGIGEQRGCFIFDTCQTDVKRVRQVAGSTTLALLPCFHTKKATDTETSKGKTDHAPATLRVSKEEQFVQ